mmetsp:Transcript_1371/g.3532  ORF Transcript_1371/g.3532 Transcript_1371/m.3532 type:complete len:326 (-) Transcript_1371:66-1043(-)
MRESRRRAHREDGRLRAVGLHDLGARRVLVRARLDVRAAAQLVHRHLIARPHRVDRVAHLLRLRLPLELNRHLRGAVLPVAAHQLDDVALQRHALAHRRLRHLARHARRVGREAHRPLLRRRLARLVLAGHERARDARVDVLDREARRLGEELLPHLPLRRGAEHRDAVVQRADRRVELRRDRVGRGGAADLEQRGLEPRVRELADALCGDLLRQLGHLLQLPLHGRVRSQQLAEEGEDVGGAGDAAAVRRLEALAEQPWLREQRGGNFCEARRVDWGKALLQRGEVLLRVALRRGGGVDGRAQRAGIILPVASALRPPWRQAHP